MKNIIITGAGDGVGKSVATMLKNENLILVDIERNNVEKVAKELNQKSFVCDVTDVKQIKKLRDFVVKSFDKIDCLINCAGMWTKGELSQLNIEHFAQINELERVKKIIDTNVFGIIAMISEFSPILISQNYGQIININSQAGINHKAERVVYNASKWGVTGFSKSLQDEVCKYGIRVTDVMPGMMKTDMFSKMNITKNMANGLDTKEVARLINFIMDTPSDVVIPEVGIKNINN